MKRRILARRILAIALVLVMVVCILAGCSKTAGDENVAPSKADESGTPEKAEIPAETKVELGDDFDYSDWVDDQGRTVITVATTADPGTYDPQQTGSSAALTVTQFEGLFYKDPETWEIKPCLAKNYEMSDDGLSVTVEIYDYIHDSQGNPITSSDIEYCYMAAKESGKANSSGIDYVEIIDDYNFILHLSSSQVGIWTNTCDFSIYSQKAYEEAENFGMNPIATGPYVLTDWQVGSSYTFEKNENYWQTDESKIAKISQTNVDVVKFTIIKEPAQQAIALELENVDIVNDLSYTEAARFMEGGEAEGTHNVFTYESILAQLMYLNMSDKSIFVNDPELRKAVLYAINRDDLILGASNGYGNICYTFGCEAGSLGFLQKWYEEDYFDYNLETAQECLEKSNYDGTTIRIVSNNSDMKKSQCQLIQIMLQAAGMNAEVLPYEDALFNTYKNDPNEWDILVDNTSSGAEIASMWRRKFDPNNFSGDQTGANFIDDQEFFDKLYACIDMGTYSDETVDAFHQALKETYSAIGLYNPLCFNVASKVVVSNFTNSTGHLLANCCTFVWNEGK